MRIEICQRPNSKFEGKESPTAQHRRGPCYSFLWRDNDCLEIWKERSWPHNVPSSASQSFAGSWVSWETDQHKKAHLQISSRGLCVGPPLPVQGPMNLGCETGSMTPKLQHYVRESPPATSLLPANWSSKVLVGNPGAKHSRIMSPFSIAFNLCRTTRASRRSLFDAVDMTKPWPQRSWGKCLHRLCPDKELDVFPNPLTVPLSQKFETLQRLDSKSRTFAFSIWQALGLMNLCPLFRMQGQWRPLDCDQNWSRLRRIEIRRIKFGPESRPGSCNCRRTKTKGCRDIGWDGANQQHRERISEQRPSGERSSEDKVWSEWELQDWSQDMWKAEQEGPRTGRNAVARQAPVAKFGEQIMYMTLQARAGQGKMRKFYDGILLGLGVKTDESITGTPDGVITAKAFRQFQNTKDGVEEVVLKKRWTCEVHSPTPCQKLEETTYQSKPTGRRAQNLEKMNTHQRSTRSPVAATVRRMFVTRARIREHGATEWCPGCKGIEGQCLTTTTECSMKTKTSTTQDADGRRWSKKEQQRRDRLLDKIVPKSIEKDPALWRIEEEHKRKLMDIANDDGPRWSVTEREENSEPGGQAKKWTKQVMTWEAQTERRETKKNKQDDMFLSCMREEEVTRRVWGVLDKRDLQSWNVEESNDRTRGMTSTAKNLTQKCWGKHVHSIFAVWRKMRLYEKRPIEKCFEKTQKPHFKVKWIDHNNRDSQNMNVRSRLLAKQMDTGKEQGLIAASATVTANKPKKLIFSDISRVYIHGQWHIRGVVWGGQDRAWRWASMWETRKLDVSDPGNSPWMAVGSDEDNEGLGIWAGQSISARVLESARRHQSADTRRRFRVMWRKVGTRVSVQEPAEEVRDEDSHNGTGRRIGQGDESTEPNREVTPAQGDPTRDWRPSQHRPRRKRDAAQRRRRDKIWTSTDWAAMWDASWTTTMTIQWVQTRRRDTEGWQQERTSCHKTGWTSHSLRRISRGECPRHRRWLEQTRQAGKIPCPNPEWSLGQSTRMNLSRL